MYCQICDRDIDLDRDVDHEEFCAEEQERMAINFLGPADKAKALRELDAKDSEAE
jgi:hypothetical protein